MGMFREGRVGKSKPDSLRDKVVGQHVKGHVNELTDERRLMSSSRFNATKTRRLGAEVVPQVCPLGHASSWSIHLGSNQH